MTEQAVRLVILRTKGSRVFASRPEHTVFVNPVTEQPFTNGAEAHRQRLKLCKAFPRETFTVMPLIPMPANIPVNGS